MFPSQQILVALSLVAESGIEDKSDVEQNKQGLARLLLRSMWLFTFLSKQKCPPGRLTWRATLTQALMSPNQLQPELVDTSVASRNDLAESLIRYASDGTVPLRVIPGVK